MPNSVEEPAPAEISYAGEWTLKAGTSPGTVHFALRYPPSASNCGGAIAIAKLGLTDRDLGGASHALRFELAREAGTFECEGSVVERGGSGSFRFRPDAAYANAIVKAGLPPLTLQKHVQAAMFDLSLSFVHDIVGIELPHVTFSQLLSFKIFRMKAEDVAAFYAMFPNDGADEIVALGVLRIKPEYVDALRRARIRGLTAANVAALSASGIDQTFIEGLVASGRNGLSIDDVVNLHRGAS